MNQHKMNRAFSYFSKLERKKLWRPNSEKPNGPKCLSSQTRIISNTYSQQSDLDLCCLKKVPNIEKLSYRIYLSYHINEKLKKKKKGV